MEALITINISDDREPIFLTPEEFGELAQIVDTMRGDLDIEYFREKDEEGGSQTVYPD